MDKFFRILSFAAVLALAFTPRISLAAGEILAVLFENGSEFSEVDGAFLFPLYCEGQGSPCGEETDSNITLFEVDANKGRIVLDVKICQGDSCLTARNALFVYDAVPEIVQPIGVTYSATMTEHDPISCQDATGIFAEAACSNNLDLNYRCLTVLDPAHGMPVKTLAGSFIISTLR